MILKLYRNTAENNRVDKTSYLTEVISIDGKLRDASSVLTPTIQMEFSDDVGIQDFVGFNYAYIPDFGRYYFVQDVTVIRTNIMVVQLIVDPLMSFKTGILALSAYIERNENEYSDTLVDDAVPLERRKIVTEYTPTAGSYVNTVFNTNLADESLTITVTLVGLQSRLTDINPPTVNLPTINGDNLKSATCTYAVRESDYGEIMNNLQRSAYSAYASYVLSVVAYPFVIHTPGTGEYKIDCVFGYDGNGNPQTMVDSRGGLVRGYQMKALSEYFVVADFKMPNPTSFLDYEPFSQYELYIPFYGWLKLDIDLVKDARLLVYYSSNRDDGSATVYVFDWTNNKIIFSSPCQLGIRLSITYTNQQELTAQKNAVGLNLAVGLVSSALSIGMGVAKGSPISVAKGTIAGASAITSAINAYSLMFPKASASFGDSTTALYTPLQVRLRTIKTINNVSSHMAQFRSKYGSPLRDTRVLNQLTGFTVVGEIHLENINAYKREKDEIERLLKLGVIL